LGGSFKELPTPESAGEFISVLVPEFSHFGSPFLRWLNVRLFALGSGGLRELFRSFDNHHTGCEGLPSWIFAGFLAVGR
jgi:hypothetical protein